MVSGASQRVEDLSLATRVVAQGDRRILAETNKGPAIRHLHDSASLSRSFLWLLFILLVFLFLFLIPCPGWFFQLTCLHYRSTSQQAGLLLHPKRNLSTSNTPRGQFPEPVRTRLNDSSCLVTESIE